MRRPESLNVLCALCRRIVRPSSRQVRATSSAEPATPRSEPVGGRRGFGPRAPTMRRGGLFDGRREGRMLRTGDVVEVRAPAEILATLDSDASIDKMPFMPEMLRYSGKRFTVSRRVEKICDTVSGGPPNSRRMRDTVLLEDLRCDGSGHGGCQAGCRLYWKESWLRRVDPDSEPEGRHGDGLAQLGELARDRAHVVRDVDGAPRESYRCQATEALRATEPLSTYDVRQYFRELTSKNVGLPRLLHV